MLLSLHGYDRQSIEQLKDLRWLTMVGRVKSGAKHPMSVFFLVLLMVILCMIWSLIITQPEPVGQMLISTVSGPLYGKTLSYTGAIVRDNKPL